MQPATPTTAVPAARASSWRPARLAKLGGIVSGAGLALVMLAGLLAPKSDAEQIQYAVESLAGSPKPMFVQLSVAVGGLLLFAGLAALAVAGLWALARSGRSTPARG